MAMENRFVRIGGVAAVVIAVAAAWGLGRLRGSEKHAAVPGETESAIASDDIDGLRAAVARLDRRSSALEAAAMVLQRADQPSQPEQPTPPAETEDPRSEIERHREALGKLDAALAADHGDPGARRSSVEAMRKQLTAATEGRARIVTVECATAFCKAAFEEDTSAHPELDTGALIDATPLLKQEAMFDYERVASIKRTTVYAALEGQSLAAARGIVTADPAGAAPVR
jgi:hypothetical protein